MPSFGSGEATAVASTTDSPWVTRAAPEACLAMRPVSKLSRLPPASSTNTSSFIESSFQLVRRSGSASSLAMETGDQGDGRTRRDGKGWAYAEGRDLSPGPPHRRQKL